MADAILQILRLLWPAVRVIEHRPDGPPPPPPWCPMCLEHGCEVDHWALNVTKDP